MYTALLLVPLAEGYANAPPEAPRILYFQHSRISVAVFHEGRITIERRFQHPGINGIVGVDVAGNMAVLRSLDPQQGGLKGGVLAQFLNLRTGERGRVLSDSRYWVKAVGLSPEGRRAALGFCEGEGRCRIDIENLSTGERRTVLRGVSDRPNIRWSPDGNHFLYNATDGAISIFDVASGETRRIVHGEFPAWSPDGRRLAFAAGHEIRVIDLSDLSEQTLHREPDWTNDPLTAAFTSWSPDGRYISFNAPGAAEYEVACKIIDLPAKTVTQISSGLSQFCGPWLPEQQ